MYSDKRRSKEDTWKAADLKRYIPEGRHGDDGRDDRRSRGESVEKQHKESQREGDKYRDNYSRKDGSRDRREERSRRGDSERREARDRRDEREGHKELRKERERMRDLSTRDYQESTNRKKDREEARDKEDIRERHRDRDKTRDKYAGEDKARRREEREKEHRREERDRAHRHDRDRRKDGDTRDKGSDNIDGYDRDRRERHRGIDTDGARDRHREGYEVSRSEKERAERHAERKSRDPKDEKDRPGKHRSHKEDRDRGHKEQHRHDERRPHDRESRERREQRGAEEKPRPHHRDGDREVKRDTQRESKHKGETDLGRRLEIRTREKDMELEQADSHTQKADDIKGIAVEDEAEPEYEDDFEEYEEDFEELDESGEEGEEKEEFVEIKEELSPKRKEEIMEIQRAMVEENKLVRALSSQNTTENEEERPKLSQEPERTSSKTSLRGNFMDFVRAKQREVNKKVATKQKKRSTELLRLIDLDFTLTSSLLDLPPMNEYDMYIRNFGTANTQQAYVQCNEDNVTRDIQTEEIELCEKWTQHPPEHNGACGDPNVSRNSEDLEVNKLNIDSRRLTAFLQSAAQVMIVLLEEGQAEKNFHRKLQTQADVLSFTDGGLQLNTKLPFLLGRHISLIHFSPVHKHTMISVHNPAAKPGTGPLNGRTLICLWNIWEPSRPQKILVYDSEVQCCCFSPGKAMLVFAGSTVGSVVLWDLREHASSHYSMTFGDETWTFRQPSFSTDAVMAASGHFSTVMSVEVVPSAVTRGQMSEVSFLASEEATGLSFQLASLDENGILIFWVVVELPKANEAGSQTDLGLRPGGKVKLLHSSSLSVADRIKHEAKKTAPLQTLQLNFLPTDPNHFFIGTNMGVVLHGTSHGLKTLPQVYGYLHGGKKPVDVNAVSFSPFRQELFLVGCADGCIRLHAVGQDQPLIEWRDCTAGQSVVSVQWSQTRPAVFCALDAASNVHLWDLMKNEMEAVITERMGKDRVTAVALFGDSGHQNTYSGVALAHESGKMDIQYFTKDFTTLSSTEIDKLNSLVNEAF